MDLTLASGGGSASVGGTGGSSTRPVQEKPLQHWLRALQWSQSLEQDEAATLLSIVERQAAGRRDALALVDERAQLTYGELVARATVYADWALSEDLGGGSVVCLIMPNCVDYVAIWLGLTHIGCVVALINTNLVGAGLAHCVQAARCSHVIVDETWYGRVSEALDAHSVAADLWTHDGSLNLRRARGHDRHETRHEEQHRPAGISATDAALLIFTSGTTGLPKAAYVTHGRILEWSGWFAGMMDAQPEDRLYDCLPMYHSVGGVVAVGAMLVAGASLVIRRQFSASRFWSDVTENDCTIFQYIGELCRYLLHKGDEDRPRPHRLRLCCGNGLRREVWTEFQARFKIPRILEYYAATEGNVSLYNCEGKPGAIGRIPPFLAHRFPVAIIRLDVTTGLPVRDADGRCIACDADETGEAIGRIDQSSRHAARRFDGYTDAAASGRKRLHDVFASGDIWFRTGDLMRRDRLGYFYFVDRLGFSFRWKGENVSAVEVAAAIMKCEGVVDAVAYGVAVPGAEGRAGMAAVVGDERLSLQVLKTHIAAELPAFARPLFIRLCRSIPQTGTFKLKTEDFAREGLAPPAVPDSLWFNDPASESMLPCDSDCLSKIASGAIRL